jgi:hypothetical protein
MKTKLTFLFALINLTLISGIFVTKSIAQVIPLAKNVEYDVFIDNSRLPSSPELDDNSFWFYKNIEASSRLAFIEILFDKVQNGNLIVKDMEGKTVKSNRIMDLFILSIDTLTMTRPYPPYNTFDTVVARICRPQNVVALRFRENWLYDTETMAFSKKVIAFAPIMASIVYNENLIGEYESLKPMFWVNCDVDPGYPEVLTKRIIYKVNLKDSVQKPAHLDSTVTSEYYGKLLKKIFAGKKNIYNWDIETNSITLLKNENLKKYLLKVPINVDSIKLIYNSPPYERYDTVIIRGLCHVESLFFREEWSFDTTNFVITKNVVGLSPEIQYIDLISGEFLYYNAPFWVYFSDLWTPYRGKIKLQK